jgi:hypothetical protein
VTYDLLLQSLEPGAPYETAPVDALFDARKASPPAPVGGGRRWQLKAGTVEVRPLIEGGKCIATEIKVPLSDKLELVREVVAEASQVATEAKVRLFDPQLSKALNPNDEGLVADQYLRTAKYAGEMMGVSEAIGASFSTPDAGTLKPGTKVVLGLVGFVIILYLIVSKLLA